ncbi:MAG TPA: autotransporter domain-containing protein, partial [Rhodanobacteraceae bacterium]|nr:autotransporter domain-containing protein [Rhodanobacteraceae bacterium]
DPVLSYQPDAVELSLERNDLDFNTVATTPNQGGAAGGANSLGWNSPLYNALVLLDASTARAAFDQLSGEYHASQQTARIDDSRYVREAMDQRLIEGSNDLEATHLEGTSVDAWAHAWGHWGTTDSDGNAGRLADNGDGLLIGADLPVGTQGRVGITGGASRDSLSIASRASWGRLTSQWLGAFGGVEAGAFALRGGIAYAWDQVPGNREIDFPGYSDRLSSNAAGNTLTGFVEGAWTFKLAQGDIEPFVDLAHTRVQTDASTEAGGPAALQASDATANVSFGTVGARGTFELANHIDVHGELGWQHAFGDTTPERTLQFVAGGSSFTEYGVPVAKNAGLGRLGVGWHQGNVAIDADYEGLSGSGIKDQAARLSVEVAL